MYANDKINFETSMNNKNAQKFELDDKPHPYSHLPTYPMYIISYDK